MDSSCIQCEKPNVALACGLCKVSVCKSCAQFADEDSITYLNPKPEFFSHGVFCPSCFSQQVEPIITNYNEVLDKAEQVNIFFKTQSKESRFIRRIEKPIKVQDCLDKDSTVMSLAFIAASQGFNILVDVEALSEKVHIHSYQTSKWKGSGIPSTIDEEKLNRRFIGAPN